MWKDANEDIYKYTRTLKNLEKGITTVDTYLKSSEGKFDFIGRTIDDKFVEIIIKLCKKHTLKH